MSVGLFITIVGLTFLALVGARVGNRQLRQVRRRRARAAARNAPKPALDEIDEYWGDAMPPVLDEDLDEGGGEMASEPEVAQAIEHEPRERRQSVPRSSPAERNANHQACGLGLAFLNSFTRYQRTLPGGEISLGEIATASANLQDLDPTRMFGHGAVVQRVGTRATLIVEPLLEAVVGSAGLIDAIIDSFGGCDFFLVLGTTPDGPEGDRLTSHIRKMVSRLSIPRENLFVLQEDGSFHTHEEDQRNFVPCRLDAAYLPAAFFERMVDYGQERYDHGDAIAVRRTLAPISLALAQRAQVHGDFDLLLLARALNLLGAANRDLECTADAATSFEIALALLKQAEDYEAVQIVESNLGMTLLRLGPNRRDILQQATKHLQQAVNLAPDDFMSWRGLAEVYTARFDTERSRSLLRRAEHAYTKALAIQRDPEVRAALDQIERLSENTLSAELPVLRNLSPLTGQPTGHSDQPAREIESRSRERDIAAKR